MSKIVLFLKSHVKGYTRRDGAYVAPHARKDGPGVHTDQGQLVLFTAPAKAPEDQTKYSPPDPHFYSKMSNNAPVESTSGSPMNQCPITAAALGEKGAAQLTDLLERLDTAGPIIKSRYAELRSDLSRCFERAARVEVSQPYLALPHEERQPEWATDVYYSCTTLGSAKKCKRILEMHAGTSAFAARGLTFFNEWEPIIARLDARKADITTTTAQRDEKKEVARRERALIPPTKLSALVKDAVEAHKPTVAAAYTDYVKLQYDRMVADLGEGLKGATNSRRWTRFYSNTMRPLLDSERKLSDSAVQAHAKAYADYVAEAMQGKIMGKAGELEQPEVKHMDGMNFVLTGELGGRKVSISQNTILNSSPLGTLFNQFPARIYVDGKFTSEAEFKKLQQK